MTAWVVAAVLAAAAAAPATGRQWENPVFATVEEAVAAARGHADLSGDNGRSALAFFVNLTLAAGDVPGRHPSSAMSRLEVENLLITHPRAFLAADAQSRTIERFVAELPRQREVLEARLRRFSYPATPGLVYLRLVDSVDAFADLSRPSSDRMTQVGGVTYYCRYIVLPLSYVGEGSVRELRRSAALNPAIDVDDTIRRWQAESFANLVSTFRHELVHVRTNSTLGVPDYSDRAAFPTWFHEGTATYLAADPHAGLSSEYQRFQNAFFYLVQRHGVRRLQDFYSEIFAGSTVVEALTDIYAITDSEILFARSGRWHRMKEIVKTGLWLTAIVIVVAALRGGDRAYLGWLEVLAAAVLALALATGLADHLFGLRGPGVVRVVEVGLATIAVLAALRGVRRIRRHRTT